MKDPVVTINPDKTPSPPLYKRVSRLRWLVVIFTFILIASHQIIEHTRLHEHVQLEMYEGVYVIIGSTLLWWVMTSLRNRIIEKEAAERALEEAHRALSKANERLTFLIEVNHRLAKAEDEESLISIMLELPGEVVPAIATSLVFLDQHQQQAPTIYHNNMEPALLEAWTAHLTDPLTRRRCATCTRRSSASPNACPLLLPSLTPLGVKKLHCLSLTSSNHEHGVLNIYLGDTNHPTAGEESLLDALAQEMSLALESQHLRTRELDMLTHIQHARQTSNLHNELAEVLTHTVTALEVNGGVLFLADPGTGVFELEVEVGQSLDTTQGIVRGIAEDSRQAETPLVIPYLAQGGATNIRSILAASIRTEEQIIVGSLVLWATRPDVFTPHRSQLVATVASQTAILVTNQRLYLQGEYQAALTERARLAREIHDGLAQALGYLKLRTAQVANHLQNGESQRTLSGLSEVQQLLNDAYVETRAALDGLHLTAQDSNLYEWLDEMVSDFAELSGIQVKTAVPPHITLPFEVQAQLQRIILESLNNIRKHACATNAWLDWRRDSESLILQIRDDGRGFDLNDVPPIARHGLRIMRERAELLPADFQLDSRPGKGTQITIKIPYKDEIDEGKDAKSNQAARGR